MLTRPSFSVGTRLAKCMTLCVYHLELQGLGLLNFLSGIVYIVLISHIKFAGSKRHILKYSKDAEMGVLCMSCNACIVSSLYLYIVTPHTYVQITLCPPVCLSG